MLQPSSAVASAKPAAMRFAWAWAGENRTSATRSPSTAATLPEEREVSMATVFIESAPRGWTLLDRGGRSP